MPIRIIVIEPLEIVRMGMCTLFGSVEFRVHGIQVAAEGSACKDIMSLYSEFQPEVVVTEVQFSNTMAFDAIDALKKAFPEAKVCIYTATDNPAFLARAAVSGVDEYLEKSAPLVELVAALVRIYEGKERPAGHKLDRVTARMKSKRFSFEHEVPLTGRELQILRHIAFGMSNKEISKSLKISIDTVKEHVQNILRKMGFRDRTHAAVWAVRKNII